MERFQQKKNFNIGSTVINEDVRISTAAIYYDEWFGERYQMETWIFVSDKGKVSGLKSKMKIHNVPENLDGIDYCERFHNKAVAIVKNRLTPIGKQ